MRVIFVEVWAVSNPDNLKLQSVWIHKVVHNCSFFNLWVYHQVNWEVNLCTFKCIKPLIDFLGKVGLGEARLGLLKSSLPPM